MDRTSALLLAALLPACSGAPGGTPVEGRWYTTEQVRAGEALYRAHCSACHGPDGSATADWRERDASGHFPPPPLNGTAHTWHHPLEVLDATIANGGAAYGGRMPGFAALLDREERLSIVAYLQDWWSGDIYRRWQAIENRSH